MADLGVFAKFTGTPMERVLARKAEVEALQAEIRQMGCIPVEWEDPVAALLVLLPAITKEAGWQELCGVDMLGNKKRWIKRILKKYLQEQNEDVASAKVRLVAALKFQKKCGEFTVMDLVRNVGWHLRTLVLLAGL
jgi:hypothetical protein